MRIVDPLSWPQGVLIHATAAAVVLLIIIYLANILAWGTTEHPSGRGAVIRRVGLGLLLWILSTGVYSGIIASDAWEFMVTASLERQGFSVTAVDPWNSTVTLKAVSSCPPITLGAWITKTPDGYHLDVEQTPIADSCV